MCRMSLQAYDTGARQCVGLVNQVDIEFVWFYAGKTKSVLPFNFMLALQLRRLLGLRSTFSPSCRARFFARSNPQRYIGAMNIKYSSASEYAALLCHQGAVLPLKSLVLCL